MSRLGQRVVIGAGWVVAAILAVLVGVIGIRLVGADLTTRPGDAVSEAQVEQELGDLPAVPSSAPTTAAPATAAPTTAAPAKDAGRSFPTRGGTVVADCGGIISMAPAQGFAVHEQRGREGEFRSVRDNHVRVKVRVTCAAGVPALGSDDD
ncbi:hypothetical protein BJY16_008458 [Actinoplanes octamycinicus]|uniref:Uncharacterized protein n=1 Tax=Actinoplanes octamycinicus TaxID=135948 RepID=A0A7W7H6V0_9ACTN|nr:hypothetical protein [Actinoplanes octamycinicus]MBB4744999.1 hypothetical protein [Actinoplanes octamycinicus]GIE55586.1 hypothetical protein Aoc01nite_09880 [Actinoplanes octamycinicus]